MEKNVKKAIVKKSELKKSQENHKDPLSITLEDYYHYFGSMSRKGEVDPNETVILVKEAMAGRSIRTFAEELDVNPSSISRILSGRTKEISAKLLSGILYNAGEDSGVTAEKLAAAQGLEKVPERKRQRARAEADCRMIISDELLRIKRKVRYSEGNDSEEANVSDFQIVTDALTGEEALWLFEFKSSFDVQTSQKSFAWWLDRVMAYYYKGGRAARVSIIVEDSIMFYVLC